MTTIIPISDEITYLQLNSLKKIVGELALTHYPLLYKDSDTMYSHAFKKRLLLAETLQGFACMNNDTMMAYIIVEWVHVSEKGALKERDFAYIHDLGTHPDFRKQGHAYALMNHVEELMRKQNIVDVELAVHVDFYEAIQLYEKLGFSARTLRLHKSVKP
ncbi:MAG: GNAT family N-acetyltransferase [Erysipelothrix sp.]|jgi:ribosomal protein S18 acetylase RimI-like enzyme|nr:GNAT family N-acetyltransferase [Erysipelothrix sp.]